MVTAHQSAAIGVRVTCPAIGPPSRTRGRKKKLVTMITLRMLVTQTNNASVDQDTAAAGFSKAISLVQTLGTLGVPQSSCEKKRICAKNYNSTYWTYCVNSLEWTDYTYVEVNQ